jgi:cellobiose-specific phosphotransferase system component IIB
MPAPLTIDSVPTHKSLIDLTTFPSNTFNSVLYGFKLKQILDDIILAKYVDETSDGSAIMRRGILIPGNSDTKAWRVGKVLLVGPTVRYVKAGDHIIFPNNLGIPIANIELEDYGTLTKGIFINEQRIFGICSQIDDNESIASIVNDTATK